MSFLKIQPDAEDVVQDVMIKCWETINESRSIENIEAFSMTMVRNKSLDKLKKKGRRYVEVSDQFDLHATENSPYKAAEQGDTMSRMKALINDLPETQKSVITLRDMEGFSYEEISEILEINLGQVKINLHRGRKQVREKLIELERYGV